MLFSPTLTPSMIISSLLVPFSLACVLELIRGEGVGNGDLYPPVKGSVEGEMN